MAMLEAMKATPRVKSIQRAALAMLVVAGVINYVDRATLAVAVGRGRAHRPGFGGVVFLHRRSADHRRRSGRRLATWRRCFARPRRLSDLTLSRVLVARRPRAASIWQANIETLKEMGLRWSHPAPNDGIAECFDHRSRRLAHGSGRFRCSLTRCEGSGPH